MSHVCCGTNTDSSNAPVLVRPGRLALQVASAERCANVLSRLVGKRNNARVRKVRCLHGGYAKNRCEACNPTLQSCDERFDVVLMDTPPSQDQLLMNALMAADWVVVPFVPHFLSYQGIKQLVRLMHSVKLSNNPRLQLAGFLPTMASKTMKHHKAVMEEVSRHFGRDRILPAIRTDIRLADAFSKGQPVIGFAPKSRAAEDFSVLSQCIGERLSEREHA